MSLILFCKSAPHPTHARAHIDARSLSCSPRRRIGCRQRPSRPFEQSEQMIGNETTSRRIDVAVAPCVLAVGKKALRHHQMQIILGAGHGDVK